MKCKRKMQKRRDVLTVIGMMMPVGRTPMRTKMGKRIQKMGIAVDHTMDDILSNLR